MEIHQDVWDKASLRLSAAGDELAAAEEWLAEVENTRYDGLAKAEWRESWREARSDVLNQQVMYEAARQHWLTLSALNCADDYAPPLA